MTLYQQILWGSLFLVICLVLQIAFLALSETALGRVGYKLEGKGLWRKVLAIFLVALIFIVSSHTAQVWIWAGIYVLFEVLPEWNSAIYFSLVTYTSLGYGDIVLVPGIRIFAGFAAVTGMLGFGISTAYLVSLFGRLTPSPRH